MCWFNPAPYYLGSYARISKCPIIAQLSVRPQNLLCLDILHPLRVEFLQSCPAFQHQQRSCQCLRSDHTARPALYIRIVGAQLFLLSPSCMWAGGDVSARALP